MGNESFFNEEDVLETLSEEEILEEELHNEGDLDELNSFDTYSDDYNPNDW